MLCRTLKKTKYRRKGQSLIASHRIKPEYWDIAETEALQALKAQGYDVKEIKKIRCLQHQVCLSYWDKKGNVCSGFFSYRIFARWQTEVEKLIDCCQILRDWQILNHIMQYEFAYYPYLSNIEYAIVSALENRLCMLTTTPQQAVIQVIESSELELIK